MSGISLQGRNTEAAIVTDGVDRIRIAADGTIIFPGAIQVQGATKSDTGANFQTGDFSLKQRTSVPAGWIVGDGSTIGNVGSGATLASAATLALFTLWWNEYNDTLLPIYTSAGVGSFRNGNAAADWAAGKRMTVFDVRDRVPRMAGSIQANGGKLEATNLMLPYPGTGGGIGVMSGDAALAYANHDAIVGRVMPYSTFGMTANAATTLGCIVVRVASSGMLGCYKL